MEVVRGGLVANINERGVLFHCAMMQAEEPKPSIERINNEVCKQEMGRDALSCEDGSQSFASLVEGIESKAAEQRNKNLDKITLPSSLLTELVDYGKVTLAKIRQINHDSVDSMDLESRKSLEETMNEEIKKFDSVLNQILYYISVSTPVIKTNTILTILEEVL